MISTTRVIITPMMPIRRPRFSILEGSVVGVGVEVASGGVVCVIIGAVVVALFSANKANIVK